MRIDADNFERLAAKGALVQRDWGDGRIRACLMGALAGVSEDKCTAAGWPLWLVQIGVWANDHSPEDQFVERGRQFYKAVQAAEARGADYDRVFRDVRLNAILPIAMRAIGDGDEPWRVECRDIVQWSIDNDGQSADYARARRAAKSAEVAGAAAFEGAARAAVGMQAAGAAEATWAARATWAATTAAVTWIFDALIAALRGEERTAQ